MTFSRLLFNLVVIFAAAKLVGRLAQRIGQPVMLGELIGGVLVGVSVLGLIDPRRDVLQLFAQLGVLILLFEIGLGSDLDDLIEGGSRSALVGLVGIAAPFALGYLLMRQLGYSEIRALFIGAALTATSIGITTRVLSELGKTETPAAKIITGAAVFNDILGLVILSVVQGLAQAGRVSLPGVAKTAGLALGFLVLAVVLGRLVAPRLVKLVRSAEARGELLLLAVGLAMLFAYAAQRVGSAYIIGAFAAGLVFAETQERRPIEQRVKPVADFFLPIFFVTIGAAVDVRVLNPFDPARWAVLGVALALILAAVAGKLASGFVVKPAELQQQLAIGAGMVPRGEVGLVFAGVGLGAGLVTRDTYAAVVAMVVVTTVLAPRLLKAIFASPSRRRP